VRWLEKSRKRKEGHNREDAGTGEVGMMAGLFKIEGLKVEVAIEPKDFTK